MLHPDYKIVFKIILIFLLLLLFIRALLIKFCFGATGYREHFLSYGPGAAATGMGETFVANGNDLTAIYYNPALLSKLNGEEISATHWFLFDTARYNFIGFLIAGDDSAFALAGTQFYRGNIEVRQKIDDVEDTTENSQMAVYGSYSGLIDKLKLNYGITGKWLTYNMYTEKASGGGIDIGVSRRLMLLGNPFGKKITVDSGLMFQNLASVGIKMINETELLPLAVKCGLTSGVTLFPKYSKKEDSLSYDELTLASDIIYTDNHFLYSFGAQYKLWKTLIFRVGYKDGVTAGLGLILFDFQLDYALMLKNFTNFHKIGFIYRFGQGQGESESVSTTKLTAIAPTFTEEFQKVFQRAKRIYERYYRDAVLLSEQNRYEEAIRLLKRAIPLSPKENTDALQLLKTCEHTIIANKMNEIITNAQQYHNKDDLVNAYKTYLKAYNLNPEDKNVRIFLLDISDKVLMPSAKESTTIPQKSIEINPKRIEISKIKEEYIAVIIKNVNFMLEQNDFFNVEKEYKKIEILAPESDEVQNYRRKIADKKSLYIYKFVISGAESLKAEKPEEAYQDFVEAQKLSPDDTGIKDQMEIAKKKFLSKRKFSFEDNIYSDKLYYLAAVNFATDEFTLSAYNELKTFNPTYEHLIILEDALIDAQMTQRRTPQR